MWDITAASSATTGENSIDAVQRELFEEIGLKADFTNMRPVITVNFSRGFCDYYCMVKDVAINTLTLQEEEVQAVKWANKDAILSMIDNDEFIPYYKSLINVFFEMKNATSSHNKHPF